MNGCGVSLIEQEQILPSLHIPQSHASAGCSRESKKAIRGKREGVDGVFSFAKAPDLLPASEVPQMHLIVNSAQGGPAVRRQGHASHPALSSGKPANLAALDHVPEPKLTMT